MVKKSFETSHIDTIELGDRVTGAIDQQAIYERLGVMYPAAQYFVADTVSVDNP